MKQITAGLLISIAVCGCNGQAGLLTQKEIKRLDSVNIDFQFRGNCYAYSSDKNAEPSHGEAHSDNLPEKVEQSFPRNGLYLTINQNDFSRIDGTFLGCKLFLVNTTDTLVTLHASDSRLYIVAEALNEKNEWAPISYLPESWCKLSNHTVKLDKDEYWGFDIPVFKGTIKTKLRYTLTINNDRKINSNEIDTYLNKGQFNPENKEGHTSNNLMYPYED